MTEEAIAGEKRRRDKLNAVVKNGDYHTKAEASQSELVSRREAD
jgi:hypothetical protein